jgi:signal transduction histidine kinase
MREHEQLPAHRRADYLGIIIGESQRLTRLIDNVLDFSRIERGGTRRQMRRVNLAEVARAAARTMAHPMEQQGFRLGLGVTDEPVWVMGDRDGLEQAVLNLLTNAVKYSGDSRDIALDLRSRDGAAVLEVIDHGIGIAESDRDRIFERFYRAEAPAGTVATGAGLGLTIVRDVADAHGGSITVDSAPGDRTVFTLAIPLAGAEVPPAAAPDASLAGKVGV